MKKKKILLFLLLIILSACSTESRKETPQEAQQTEQKDSKNIVLLNDAQMKALDLKLGKLTRRNLSTYIKVTGQLEIPPFSKADVSAFIGGNVKKINVFYGDFVRKGHLLALLEHPDYIALQERYAKLAPQIEYLKQEYERQEKLFKQNASAGKNYQKAKAEYFSALGELNALKTQLRLLNLSPEQVAQGKISTSVPVYSPITGYVNKINIHSGAYVQPKDLLFEIINNSDMHADLVVYEKDIPFVKKGQKVILTTSNVPGKELEAEVFAIGKEFETDIRAVHIHAELRKQVPGLIVGTYVTGYIYADTVEVSALPEDAVVSDGEKSYIFVTSQKPRKDGTRIFKKTEIIPGRQDNGYIEIRLLNPLPPNSLIAQNNAYYLLSELEKEDSGHDH